MSELQSSVVNAIVEHIISLLMIFSVFYCLSPYCFLSIEFHYTFSISYKIMTNYVYYCCIFIRLLLAVGTSFLFLACFTSFHTHGTLLTFFVSFFILFHSCGSHARVFGKTLLHKFLIFYSRTEYYLLFFDSVTTSAQCEFGAKN